MGLLHAKCNSLVRMDGKTVVITGCNTGIGRVTAKDLFQRGAKVIMACRSMEKANEARDQIRDESKNLENVGQIETTKLDLNSLDSVRECAKELLRNEEQINVLINNAGIMMCPKGQTKDGFEMQMGTNHFGHFLFTMLLLPKIVKSTPARIVTVSSLAHTSGTIDFDDLNWERKSYSAMRAYQQSKLANVLFSSELGRKLEEAGHKDVHTYSLHPGVVKTELGRHLDDTYFKGFHTMFRVLVGWLCKSPEQGAQTSIHCAVSDEAAPETGLYYAECKPKGCSREGKNENVAKKLWDESVKLVELDTSYNPFK